MGGSRERVGFLWQGFVCPPSGFLGCKERAWVHFLFSFFLLLGPHARHMEIPRLGAESELQLPVYTTATAMPDLSCMCDLHRSSQQRRILNPLSEARDQTRILMDSRWIFHLLSHNRSSPTCLF